MIAIRTEVWQTAPGTAIDQDFDFREFEGWGFKPNYAVFEILNMVDFVPVVGTFYVTAILSQTDSPGSAALGLSSSKYPFAVWKYFYGNGVQASGPGSGIVQCLGDNICQRGNMSVRLDSVNSGTLVGLGVTVYGELMDLTELERAQLSFIPV
jgi:hypothetical protein